MRDRRGLQGGLPLLEHVHRRHLPGHVGADAGLRQAHRQAAATARQRPAGRRRVQQRDRHGHRPGAGAGGEEGRQRLPDPGCQDVRRLRHRRQDRLQQAGRPRPVRPDVRRGEAGRDDGRGRRAGPPRAGAHGPARQRGRLPRGPADEQDRPGRRVRHAARTRRRLQDRPERRRPQAAAGAAYRHPCRAAGLPAPAAAEVRRPLLRRRDGWLQQGPDGRSRPVDPLPLVGRRRHARRAGGDQPGRLR